MDITKRAVTGWLLAAFGIWMAFTTATTASDQGLRIAMIVAIGLLLAALVVDVTVWARQRGRGSADG